MERISSEVDHPDIPKDSYSVSEAGKNFFVGFSETAAIKVPKSDGPDISTVRSLNRKGSSARLAETEILESGEHGYLLLQKRSDLSHEEVVDQQGIYDTIARDVEMFDELIDEGIVLEDAKPENIHYFEEDGINQARSIDFLDEDAFSTFEEVEEIPPSQIQSTYETYLFGGGGCLNGSEGLTDVYGITYEKAMEKLVSESEHLDEEGLLEAGPSDIGFDIGQTWRYS